MRGLDAVRDRVAVVEQPAQIGLVLVGVDDVHFHANGALDDLIEG